jgi:hypothetical protein
MVFVNTVVDMTGFPRPDVLRITRAAHEAYGDVGLPEYVGIAASLDIVFALAAVWSPSPVIEARAYSALSICHTDGAEPPVMPLFGGMGEFVKLLSLGEPPGVTLEAVTLSRCGTERLARVDVTTKAQQPVAYIYTDPAEHAENPRTFGIEHTTRLPGKMLATLARFHVEHGVPADQLEA